jgi:transposase
MGQKPRLAKSKKLIKRLHGATATERFLHRLHCVAVVMDGRTAVETARIFEDSPRAVAYWVTRYKKHGVEGLFDEEKSGRPSRLSALQVEQVSHFVSKLRERSQPVNATMLANYIKKNFGVTFTIRQCWRILKPLK